MKQTILFAIIFIFSYDALQGQSDLLFDDTSLPEVRITIDPTYLDQILAEGNEFSDVEFSADFHFKSSAYEATETNIGFRLRGNTSRNAAKKSFKVSFNAFEKGRDLEGIEKLNLNGEHNDPSIIRSKICWDLMQQMGVEASRANHIKLYINNEYRGLYINVEHVDEEFVDDRFGEKSGNLYKCLYPADLNYKGDDPNLYKESSGGRRNYELTTNEEVDDYSDLANFIKVLNKTQIQNLEEELEKVFDVNSYLKILAVEVMTGHWDNYGFNQNNFYLYHNPADDKFYYLPFDLDNTLGVDFFSSPDRTTVNMYEWYDKSKNRPLVKRIMSIQRYRDLLSTYMEQLIAYYQPDVLFPRIDELKAMITAAAEADTYKSLDYGFTNEDFNNSYTSKIDYGFVRFGLKEFITKRYENTVSQLIITGLAPTPKISSYPNPTKDQVFLNLPTGSYSIAIQGVDGRTFHAFNVSGGQTEVSLSGLLPSAGLYLLNIQETGGSNYLYRLLYQP